MKYSAAGGENLLWSETTKLWETWEEAGKVESEYAQNTDWIIVQQNYYSIYNYKYLGTQCFISSPLKAALWHKSQHQH